MKTFRTITASELIERLQELPEDALVAFSSDYGDYIHTQQIHIIKGEISEENLYESAYSGSGFAIKDNNNDDESEEETQKVYIIS